MRTKLLLLSLILFGFFTYFSYTVAKEGWTQFDFDTTVKLQDRIPQRFDKYFSYLSLLGSAEVTFGFCLILALLALSRLNILAALGWFMIVPAVAAEVFGKMVLYHPAPPVFLHRTISQVILPSFYVHTNFSYPSGHMVRTAFIATVLIILLMVSSTNRLYKLTSAFFLLGLITLMGITRVSLGEHWVSDVIGGAILGMASALFASVLILKPKLV